MYITINNIIDVISLNDHWINYLFNEHNAVIVVWLLCLFIMFVYYVCVLCLCIMFVYYVLRNFGITIILSKT